LFLNALNVHFDLIELGWLISGLPDKFLLHLLFILPEGSIQQFQDFSFYLLMITVKFLCDFFISDLSLVTKGFLFSVKF